MRKLQNVLELVENERLRVEKLIDDPPPKKTKVQLEVRLALITGKLQALSEVKEAILREIDPRRG